MVFKLPLFSPCLLLIFSKLAPAIFVSSFDFFSFKFFIYKYMLFIFAMHLLLCSKFVYIQDPDISFYFIFFKKNIFNFHNASIALQWFWIYWVLIFNTCIKWCSCILGLYKLNIERQVLPLKVDATFFFLQMTFPRLHRLYVGRGFVLLEDLRATRIGCYFDVLIWNQVNKMRTEKLVQGW